MSYHSDFDEADPVDAIAGGLVFLRSDGMDDWWSIERVEHDGREWMQPTAYGHSFMRSARVSDADVEGTREEMGEIADAIEARKSFHAKRCAVEVVGDSAQFWSPRNSQRRGSVSLAVADLLAKQIRGAR